MVEEKNAPRNDAAVGIAQIHQPRQSPETAEDFILCALERATLDEVVEILRDWRSAKEVRKSLNRLHRRDPVDRFMHARRHAVEIYAKKHGLTPARLMVSIVGDRRRKDPIGAERYKLRKAREWSCPCLVERRWLSFGHNGLECDRRLIAERGVASGWIVEAVDVTANGVFGVLSGLESGPPDEF